MFDVKRNLATSLKELQKEIGFLLNYQKSIITTQMTLSHFSDEQLVELLTQGQEAAFREIYERYWRKLTSIAIFKTSSREVAEEIVQELFVSLWEKRAMSQITHLESYLFTALKYKTISYIRQTINNRMLVEASDYDAVTTLQEYQTVSVLQNQIEEAIACLPEKTQMVFRMSRFEEKSHREISHLLNVSEKAIEYHITQALKVLRISLKDYLIYLLLFIF